MNAEPGTGRGPDAASAAPPLADDRAPAPRVLVLNGVNLGRLGRREPGIYGSTTHAELAARLVQVGRTLGLDVEVRQTDFEGEMVQWLHEAADEHLPVVLNPAAWTHYSIAIADAVAQVDTLVEVHISNVHQREGFRHHSFVSPHATGTIVGLGLHGYELALAHVAGLVTGSGAEA